MTDYHNMYIELPEYYLQFMVFADTEDTMINLIRRGLDPFKVVIRKLVCSFRTRIIQINNVLLETIIGSIHFMHSKLTRKWNAAALNLRP